MEIEEVRRDEGEANASASGKVALMLFRAAAGTESAAISLATRRLEEGDGSAASGTEEAKRRIVDEEVSPREDAGYRAVMDAYRDKAPGGAAPDDVLRCMAMLKEFGVPGERLVLDQHGGIMKGYRAWDAINLLIEMDESYARLRDDLVQNCLVRVVNGPEDARRQIRQLHLHQRDRSIKGPQYNKVIADQIRDFQKIIDENWPTWAASMPQINGRFRVSSNRVAKLMGVDNKKVDRVMQAEDDLRELLYLDVMDWHGNIQKGKARPGDETRRGRKPGGNSPYVGAGSGTRAHPHTTPA